MSAKEMFEKLGYKEEKALNGCMFQKYYIENGSVSDWHDATIISNKLSQAINKQMEELGWNK